MKASVFFTRSCAAALLLSPAAQAVTLVGYDFNAVDGANASVTDPAIITTTAVTGNGGPSFGVVGTIGDTTGVAASGSPFGATTPGSFGSINTGLTTGSLAAAITAGDFIDLSFVAATPGSLNLTGFSVDTAIANLTNNRAADTFSVLFKTNGDTSPFTAADALGASVTTTALQGSTTWQSNFINLATFPSLQGIDSAQFRIYLFGGAGPTASSRTNIDNLVIEGTVIEAIPEPSRAILMAAGLMGFALRRRR